MGYTCGLYTFPLFKECETVDDLKKEHKNVNFYEYVFKYEANSWARDKFASPEEYANYMISSKEGDEMHVEQERLEFYKGHITEDELSDLTLSPVQFWAGSRGAYLEPILNKVFPDKKETALIRKTDLEKLIQQVWKELSEYSLVPCNIRMAFKAEETEYIDDEPSLHLFPCDGVEFSFDGGIKRCYTNEENTVLVVPGDVDEEKYLAMVEFLGACIKLLNFDFKHNGVLFNGGW